MADAGYFLMAGIGVEKNVSYGLTLMGAAAGMGSDSACCFLGTWHFEGRYGLPQDNAEAKHWLTKAVDGNCSTNHLNDGMKERARKHLKELEERQE